MATEEQTSRDYNAILAGGTGSDKFGQRLTITNRSVSKLGFWLRKRGSPTGDITFEIRKVSDDSVIVSKVWGAGSTLPETTTYCEVTFDTATVVNEEVRIVCAVDEDSEDNGAIMGYTRTDEKADEYTSYIINHPGDDWQPQTGWDTAYIYTYTTPTTAPTVTIQAVTAISGTTATGNGNVTALGDAPVTQHGHCWNTTGTPDTDDSKTENGAKAATGAFTSSITGLTAGTKYYVRAYAINSVGTSYSGEVVFWADEGTVFPSDTVARVSSIRHIFRPGLFAMQVALGALGFDIDIAEASVRAALDTAKEVEEAPPEPVETYEQRYLRLYGVPPPEMRAEPGEAELREADPGLWRERDRMVREQEERRQRFLEESREQDRRLWEANERLKREQEERERKLREEVERLQATAHPLLPREGAYACPYCSAKFNTAMALTRHIESAHPRGATYGRGIYGGGL